jgi:hypothetical protein
MNRFRFLCVVGAAILLVAPSLATAQEGPEPLTWVGMVTLKPGAGPQFEKAFEKYNKPLFDQLVADGKALSWGLGYELAGPGGFDYVMWITMPGWAGMGEVEAAFDARYEGLSEEELGTMIEDWMAAVEPGKDQSQLLRHAVFKANPDAAYKYLRLSAFTVKPGSGGDVMKMYKSFVAPVYEKLLEEGVIAGYGMAVQAVHSDQSFTHESWITFNNLADLEAVEKAFEAADEDVSDGDGVARETAYMKMFKHGSHYDRLIRVSKQSE